MIVAGRPAVISACMHLLGIVGLAIARPHAKLPTTIEIEIVRNEHDPVEVKVPEKVPPPPLTPPPVPPKADEVALPPPEAPEVSKGGGQEAAATAPGTPSEASKPAPP